MTDDATHGCDTMTVGWTNGLGVWCVGIVWLPVVLSSFRCFVLVLDVAVEWGVVLFVVSAGLVLLYRSSEQRIVVS